MVRIWMFGLSLFSWLSWATGSFLGGLFADQVSNLPQFLQAALDFLLPALFLKLLLAAFKKTVHLWSRLQLLFLRLPATLSTCLLRFLSVFLLVFLPVYSNIMS